MQPNIAAACAGPGFVAHGAATNASRSLVCFHFAGGSAQSFYGWRKEMPAEWALLAAELPGRGRRFSAPFATSIGAAADQLARAWKPFAHRPAVFYGHSLGGLVAYETVRALRRMALPQPQLLVVSSCAAPRSPGLRRSLPKLSDADLHHYLEVLQGTPQAVLACEDMMASILPVLRADLQLIYDYVPASAPSLDIPLHVVGAASDNWVPLESLLDWRDVTRGGFHLQMLEGGHFSSMTTPEVVLRTVASSAERMSRTRF